MTSNRIGQLALKALLYEVSTSPKPGLVDRHNSGAHKDMDYFTFMASGASIAWGFHQLASMGAHQSGVPIKATLEQIRPIGQQMEAMMFDATSGINTHKGMIFSLGLVTYVAGRIGNLRMGKTIESVEIMDLVSEMTQGICAAELTEKSHLDSNGEKVFRRFGTFGIRGEVEAGFPTLRKEVVDFLKRGCYDYVNINDYFLQLLFMIMKQCEDTTILHRHDPKVLEEVKLRASTFLEKGGMMQSDALDQVKAMDQEFIERRISPGGSADLLAVSVMLGLLQGSIQ